MFLNFEFNILGRFGFSCIFILNWNVRLNFFFFLKVVVFIWLNIFLYWFFLIEYSILFWFGLLVWLRKWSLIFLMFWVNSNRLFVEFINFFIMDIIFFLLYCFVDILFGFVDVWLVVCKGSWKRVFLYLFFFVKL